MTQNRRILVFRAYGHPREIPPWMRRDVVLAARRWLERGETYESYVVQYPRLQPQTRPGTVRQSRPQVPRNAQLSTSHGTTQREGQVRFPPARASGAALP